MHIVISRSYLKFNLQPYSSAYLLEKRHPNQSEIALRVQKIGKEVAEKRPEESVEDPMAVHVNSAERHQWDANVHC